MTTDMKKMTSYVWSISVNDKLETCTISNKPMEFTRYEVALGKKTLDALKKCYNIEQLCLLKVERTVVRKWGVGSGTGVGGTCSYCKGDNHPIPYKKTEIYTFQHIFDNYPEIDDESTTPGDQEFCKDCFEEFLYGALSKVLKTYPDMWLTYFKKATDIGDMFMLEKLEASLENFDNDEFPCPICKSLKFREIVRDEDKVETIKSFFKISKKYKVPVCTQCFKKSTAKR